MTDTPTSSSPVAPTALDVQDPLPEANWLWRRVFTFATTAIILGILIGLAIATNRIVGNVVGRIDTMSAVAVAEIAKQALTVILVMFRLTFWALMVTITYYMVAPSAEQITKMIQTAGLLKGGVKFASTRLTTDSGEGTTTTATAASAGQDPAPQVIVPPIAVVPAPAEAPADELPEYAR